MTILYTESTILSGDDTMEKVYRFDRSVLKIERAFAILEATGDFERKGYRCHHPYDCCGHWYPGAAIILMEGGQLVVKQVWHRNV